MTNDQLREIFNATHIHNLTSAARASGLSFRNGELGKAALIDKLLDSGNAMAAYTWLQNRVTTPQPAPVSQVSQQPIESAPMTQNPPAVVGQEASQLAVVLQSILSRPQGIDEPAVRAIVADALKGIDLTPSVTINLPEQKTIVLEETTHEAFPALLRKLHAKRHVLMVGDAGTGKTHACEQAAKALGLPFHVQGAVTYAHELLGYKTATGEYVRTPVREAAEHGGLLLIDEADASSPEAPLVINSLLANSFIAFPDGLVKRHPDFRCIVAVNTDGSGATMQYSGRARLDGAFLNRFVRLNWGIDAKLEKSLAGGYTDWLAAVRAVRKYCAEHQIQDVIATPRSTANGAALLAAGETPAEVMVSCLQFGALVHQWDAVMSLDAVQSFVAGF